MLNEHLAETLFDPDVYGPGSTARLRTQPSSREIPVEDLAPGWRWVRNHNGVLPYAHLIKAQMGTGAVLTCCDRTGTTLSNEGITQMRRCPECDIAVQLA